MQPIDIEEVKRVSAKVGRRSLTQPRMPLTSPALTGSQELLRSYLAILCCRAEQTEGAAREERPKLLEAREAETAKNLASDQTLLRQSWKIFAKQRGF